MGPGFPGPFRSSCLGLYPEDKETRVLRRITGKRSDVHKLRSCCLLAGLLGRMGVGLVLSRIRNLGEQVGKKWQQLELVTEGS